MEIFIDKGHGALSKQEILDALEKSVKDRVVKNVLIIPPDFTRFHSNAGLITNFYYHYFVDKGAHVDILPALGTHIKMSPEQVKEMFIDIPYDVFIEHKWKEDVVKIGEIPGDYISSITEGIWTDKVDVEINKLVVSGKYDLIISTGQVVPHEVVGMANHAKNLFVGCGGKSMINASHMIGALYGIERILGKDHTPVRALFDYAFEHYLKSYPILFVLTVTSNSAETGLLTHGLFIGEERNTLEKAIALSLKINFTYVKKGIKKCIVYLDPKEFVTTWLGNKAVYRTRMAIADGGELIVLAPGVIRFGEDLEVDKLIRKYGYAGRKQILEWFKNERPLIENMGTAAHLIHGSSDGRFSVTYAVKNISKEEIAQAKFIPADYDEIYAKYHVSELKPGYNTVNGEEIYFIPNPALGLWIDESKLKN